MASPQPNNTGSSSSLIDSGTTSPAQTLLLSVSRPASESNASSSGSYTAASDEPLPPGYRRVIYVPSEDGMSSSSSEGRFSLDDNVDCATEYEESDDEETQDEDEAVEGGMDIEDTEGMEVDSDDEDEDEEDNADEESQSDCVLRNMLDDDLVGNYDNKRHLDVDKIRPVKVPSIAFQCESHTEIGHAIRMHDIDNSPSVLALYFVLRKFAQTSVDLIVELKNSVEEGNATLKLCVAVAGKELRALNKEHEEEMAEVHISRAVEMDTREEELDDREETVKKSEEELGRNKTQNDKDKLENSRQKKMSVARAGKVRAREQKVASEDTRLRQIEEKVREREEKMQEIQNRVAEREARAGEREAKVGERERESNEKDEERQVEKGLDNRALAAVVAEAVAKAIAEYTEAAKK